MSERRIHSFSSEYYGVRSADVARSTDWNYVSYEVMRSTLQSISSTSAASGARRITNAYGEWMERLESEGFNPFLLTFKFAHIPGSPLSVQKAMEHAVERVYATSLTHIFRYPNSRNNQHWQPRWIACPDYPVFKGGQGGRSSLRDVTVNGGRHMHAIAMVPSQSRLKLRFDLHLIQEEARYVQAPLLKLHAELVRDRLGYVTTYALKAIERMRVDNDELVVLPRTRREMPSKRDRRLTAA